MHRFVHALVLTLFCIAPLGAQDGGSGGAGDPPTGRLTPTEAGVQEQIDGVFGDLIAAVSYYPFYNIAGWFGLDTSPHLQLGEDGAPEATAKKVLPGDRDATVVDAHFGPGDAIVARLSDGGVMLADPRSGKEWITIDHGGELIATALYPGSGLPAAEGELMTAGADGRVRFWRVTRNAERQFKAVESLSVGGHEGGITCAAYSATGRWFASGDGAGNLRLWEGDGKAAQTMGGHAGGVGSVSFQTGADNTEFAVTIDGEGTARVWTLSGEAKLVADPGDGQALTRVVLASDGSRLAGMRADGQVVVFDDQGAIEKTIDGQEATAVWIGWKGDGDLAVVRANGVETVYAQADLAEIADAKKDLGSELSAAPASGYYTVLEGAGQPPTLTLLNAGDDQHSEWPLAGLSGPLAHSHFNGSGDRLLTISDTGTLEVWEWFQRGPSGGLVSTSIPFVVLWLVVAAVLFTVFMGFVNIRMFKHAIQVVAGKFSDPNDHGEVSHFQALASALSATVGLGNIAGVAIAVSVGGPGATFWMIVAGLLGMTLKFTECTLGQKFRTTRADGRVSGGPMHYLKDGLAAKGLGFLGVPLALIFTLFCIGGSLAGGNAFQVNQSLGILQSKVPFFVDNGWIYGAVMAFFVGIVIIGGIQRIAQTAEKIVPSMCGLYILAALAVIVMNIGSVPAAFGSIFSSALSGDAVYGGALGALIMGFQRAAFSNEAGVGSASIAHSAARTPYPVREGIVALLEPFIDTVVVCTITALVIGITGVCNDPANADMVAGSNGAALTLTAFESVGTIGVAFGWLLMIAVVLFAFSTMISWSYYGERCWTNVFGDGSSLLYKILFLAFVVLGSVVTATNVLGFGDLMILLMAFPNILGLYFLGGVVKRELNDYEAKMQSGEIQPFK